LGPLALYVRLVGHFWKQKTVVWGREVNSPPSGQGAVSSILQGQDRGQDTVTAFFTGLLESSALGERAWPQHPAGTEGLGLCPLDCGLVPGQEV
jgi:hypothetical protein